MPTYNYRCNSCEKKFQVVHKLTTRWTTCPYCNTEGIEKTVTAFAAEIDTSYEAKMRHYEEQSYKDIERFHNDDKFAANITGQDDLKSEERRQKVLREQLEKQKKSQEKAKQEGWNFSNKK